MLLSLAQMPALSSGEYDPHGDTAYRVGLVPSDHVPCICTVYPPDHLVTSYTSSGMHVPWQKQSGRTHCTLGIQTHESPNQWLLGTAALSPAKSLFSPI